MAIVHILIAQLCLCAACFAQAEVERTVNVMDQKVDPIEVGAADRLVLVLDVMQHDTPVEMAGMYLLWTVTDRTGGSILETRGETTGFTGRVLFSRELGLPAGEYRTRFRLYRADTDELIMHVGIARLVVR